MITVEVSKTSNESTANLLRRFTRKIRGTGILRSVRSKRYHQRKMSSLQMKSRALKNIERRKEIERLMKLGKMPS